MESMLPSQKERELSSSYNRRLLLVNLAVLLVVFVAVTFIHPNGKQKNLFTWDDEDLVITCPDDAVYTIPYADMTHILLVENADLGTCLTGESGSSYRYGQWENAELGKYTLCAYKSFDTVIQINTEDSVYRLSYESPETTKGLYTSIVETLKAEGYSFEITPS